MPDPYTNPDALPESSINAMITRLEERGKHHAFVRMIQAYVNTVPKDRALTVLDLGCGTGVVIREMLHRLHERSVFHGADISLAFLKAASRCDIGQRIQWDHLTTDELPYAAETFDVIVMHTLLSHVPDPASILCEARRVMKPGGRLIVFDADHASTTYSLPCYETTRRMDHLLTSAIATNPDICRQLPRLLQSSGFMITSHVADVISECGKGDYWLSSVQGFQRLMPSLGVLTEAESEMWYRHMMDSHENGTFFAAGAFYTFFARAQALG